jgi:eukaryotic-like serine/threonine-protein kinase
LTGALHKLGDLVGNRYRVIGYIGQGGMQEVYRVRDVLLERDAVLKSPKNPSAKKRFKRSAMLSARVNHHNVAKTLDYLEEDDRFYLIEEFVPGCDLGQFLSTCVPVLDPFSAGRVLHHLAKGLAASHHAGVVHRDLKPTNVMVVGGRDFIDFKLTDFGIAIMAAEEIGDAVAGDEQGLTSSQTALGALPYMAPETIDDMRQAGKPADVWAIGAMTYEILTGKRPFGTGYKAVPLIQAANVPPLPATLTNKPQFGPFAQAIYDILKLCLQKDQLKRPSADDLVKLCEGLYYSVVPREFCLIQSFQHDAWGFAASKSGEVFFHKDSIYEATSVAVGEAVWLSAYQGTPQRRAFPVVRAKKP